MEARAWRVSRWERDEEGAGWAGLPPDLLQRVLRALPRRDLRSAAAACTAWRAAAAPVERANVLLERGKAHMKQQDLDLALACFTEAAAMGSAKGMSDTGLVHWRRGEREAAVAWYRRAAEAGDAVGACNLGLALWSGEGVERDVEEAARLFRVSAAAGNTRAQYQLGNCYRAGRGVRKSRRRAAVWWEQAAQGGCAKAMFNLGLALAKEGRGRKWLELAAQAGHAGAMCQVGADLAEEGEGVAGLTWLELAAARAGGGSEARGLRDHWRLRLGEQGTAEARRRAAAWEPTQTKMSKGSAEHRLPP